MADAQTLTALTLPAGEEWLSAMDAIAEDDGYLEKLGANHWAFFAEQKPTLLVTFERAETIRAREDNLPAAYAMAKARGWSLLTLIAEGETWWRDRAVWGYFDRLVDDAFFDDFDQVLFTGAGAAGYAACTYAVTAPGCRVLAIAPRATLDPDMAGWDRRNMAGRRLDFTSRYGYAPDMTEGAAHVWLVNDPQHAPDAMHAALFRAPWITHLHARRTGAATERALIGTRIMDKLLEDAMAGTLTKLGFAKHWRSRRTYSFYLKTLLNTCAAAKRPELEMRICRSVTRRMKVPRFANRLAELAAVKG